MKIGVLAKKKDACHWYRVSIPTSHLVLRGHEVKDELIELGVSHCPYCKKGIGAEIQYEDEIFEFKCPHCGQLLIPEGSMKEWRERVRQVIDWSDFVVFQRITSRAHINLMKEVRLLGKKVIFEGDDNYIDVPPSNTGYSYYMKIQPEIREILEYADALTVTTNPLKERYLEFNKNIYVLPNSLDIEMMDVEEPLDDLQFNRAQCHGTNKYILEPLPLSEFNQMREGKTVIGWGGSPTHQDDLKIIQDAAIRLARQNKNVIFLFFGFTLFDLMNGIPRDQLVLLNICPVSLYNRVMKTLHYDIGICPVKENLFNACKSNLKQIELFYYNAFPICSDFVTYRDSINQGFLADNVSHSWHSKMRYAVGMDKEERKVRIEENRKYLLDHFDIKKNVEMWEQVYGRYL